MSACRPSPDAARLVTPAMLGALAGARHRAAVDRAVGLYPYLGVEILIWSIYALAFNLVLGTAGLPSFGHGAYFGIGAYAFGLCQFNVVANLWVCLARRAACGGPGRRAGGAVHLAPARHLLRLHDHRLRPDLLDHRDQVAQHHRRRGRAAEDRAAAGRFRRRLVRSHRQRRALLLRAGRVRARRRSALWRLVHSPYGRVRRRDPPERNARRASRLSRLALQGVASSRCRRRCRGSPAVCSPWRSSPPSPT